MRFIDSIKSILTAALLAALATSAVALDLGRELNFDIPPQKLSSALLQFSHQARVQVVVGPEVGELTTAGVNGKQSISAALTSLLGASGLSYSLVGDSSIAVGKPESNRSSETETSSVSESSNSELAEVVVTATKRAERLQDVPISMAVVTAEDIERRGLVSGDYLRGIPGVNQMEGGTLGASIVIRGLETNTTFQNTLVGGTTVATYFGETPTTTSAGLGGATGIDLKLVDIERVEVLRGPQGTAFGSAAMGGAVRTIPRAPKLDRREGKVGVGYSATSGAGGDNYNFQAVGNLPLIQDKLAIRVVGYKYEESGFYRNRAGSDADFRAAAVTPYGAEALAVDEEEMGGASFVGGRIAALFQASDDLRFTLSYLHQKTETDGFAAATIGPYEQAILRVGSQTSRRGEPDPLFDTNIDIANAVMEYSLGWGNLLATYSYTNSGSDGPLNFTLLGIPWPLSYETPGNHRAHVGEIRLATQLEGPWNFLTGLYTEDLKDNYQEIYVWDGDPATNFFALGERELDGYLDRRTLKHKAAFGEISWKLARGLTLTGGVRAYEYDRTYRFDGDGAFFSTGVHESRDTDASGTNFRANMSYQLRDGALVYGGWSEGFRLGRPQLGYPIGTCDLNQDGLVDGTNINVNSASTLNSDKVDNYELGAKFTLLERRLMFDASVFRMNWQDIPVPVRLPRPLLTPACRVSTTASPVFANVGMARSEGVELQTNLRVTDAFRVDLGGSWIRARLREDVAANGAVKGQRLPGGPEVNANLGLQYGFALGGREVSVRADAIYVGSFYTGIAPPSENGGRAGDYVKLDASFRVAMGTINIDLFARNLTDEDAFTSRFIDTGAAFFGSLMRPRTIGLQLSADF